MKLKLQISVSYLPLSESVDSWVNAILSVNPNTDRGEYAEKLITEGYDIRCVNKEFVSLVFHE